MKIYFLFNPKKLNPFSKIEELYKKRGINIKYKILECNDTKEREIIGYYITEDGHQHNVYCAPYINLASLYPDFAKSLTIEYYEKVV
jgi:hypothetical protein